MRTVKICSIAFAALCAFATCALAADTGEHEFSWSNTAFRVINLATFLGLCWYFFGKKVTALLRGRSAGIAGEISDLEQKKAEAEQKLAEVEKRIATLEDERKALIAEYVSQGEALKSAILAKAEDEAKAVSARAQTALENEIRAAVQEIRAELAEKIAGAAEELVLRKLDAVEHARLIDNYLAKVAFH
ncbi:MAG: ATP synthase F0 subunit B [Desulfovibrio sp.]|nr:ATP synthase F0 subunit B [Desulfovibrio sp.]